MAAVSPNRVFQCLHQHHLLCHIAFHPLQGGHQQRLLPVAAGYCAAPGGCALVVLGRCAQQTNKGARRSCQCCCVHAHVG